MRFDRSNTTSQGSSGVSVAIGTPGGVPDGVPGGKGKPDAPIPTAQGPKETTGTPWKPTSAINIRRLPDPVNIPKINCPASKSKGLEGVVVLKVQVQRDGKVRRVRVVKGIGADCDKVAAKALRLARFKPAIGTNGKAVDHELRYEYEFILRD